MSDCICISRLNDVFYADYEVARRAEVLKDLGPSPAVSDSDWGPDNSNNNIVIDVESQQDQDAPARVKLPGEPLKAVVSLVFLVAAWVANTSSLALTHEFVPVWRQIWRFNVLNIFQY